MWFADNGGAVNQVGSTKGAGWTSPTQLADSSTGLGRNYPAAQGATDGVTHRVAIAYGTNGRIDVRTFDGGGLHGPQALVGSWPRRPPDDLHRRLRSGDRAVRLLGPARGVRRVSWRERPRGSCDTTKAAARVDVVVTASSDDGGDWSPPVRLTNAAAAPFRTNDEPSLVLSGWVQRIAFDRYQSTFAAYRVGMRSGS